MPKSKKEAEPLAPKEETGLPNDLDPTVSHTDLELGELGEPPPQTDFENPGDQLPEGTPGAVPQTGPENSTDEEFEGAADPLSQTDPDQSGGAEEDQAPSGSDADALPTPSQPKKRAAGKRSA